MIDSVDDFWDLAAIAKTKAAKTKAKRLQFTIGRKFVANLRSELLRCIHRNFHGQRGRDAGLPQDRDRGKDQRVLVIEAVDQERRASPTAAMSVAMLKVLATPTRNRRQPN